MEPLRSVRLQGDLLPDDQRSARADRRLSDRFPRQRRDERDADSTMGTSRWRDRDAERRIARLRRWRESDLENQREELIKSLLKTRLGHRRTRAPRATESRSPQRSSNQ